MKLYVELFDFGANIGVHGYGDRGATPSARKGEDFCVARFKDHPNNAQNKSKALFRSICDRLFRRKEPDAMIYQIVATARRILKCRQST